MAAGAVVDQGSDTETEEMEELGQKAKTKKLKAKLMRSAPASMSVTGAEQSQTQKLNFNLKQNRRGSVTSTTS